MYIWTWKKIYDQSTWYVADDKIVWIMEWQENC